MPAGSLDWLQLSLVGADGPWINFPARAYGSGTFEVETLVDAGRSADGYFIGSVIGDDKSKINCAYPPLSNELAHLVFSTFHRPTGGKFIVWVKFYDIRVNAVVVKRMYVGNRKGQPIKWGPNVMPSNKALWLGVEANLVEV